MAYNIADLFEHTVDSVADREVLVVGQQRRTYAQLEGRANQLAHHLLAQGIGPGDHVGVYGSNSVEWIEAALAAYKARAVPVNVNFRYVEEELRYLFDNADVKAVVYDKEFAPRISRRTSRAPSWPPASGRTAVTPTTWARWASGGVWPSSAWLPIPGRSGAWSARCSSPACSSSSASR
jgi:acyl-CoA synthetase (AMP-forming)/AMP-acid ligase II